MISRCYNPKISQRNTTYVACSVADEWLTLSNFKKWMEQQDWQGKQLDKDILFPGNKIYSRDTCAFVSQLTNSFLTAREAGRGSWPIGVVFDKRTYRFRARCNNPFTKKSEHLGFFESPLQAHKAWLARKHELSCEIAKLQSDLRVAAALRLRFSNNYNQGVIND